MRIVIAGAGIGGAAGIQLAPDATPVLAWLFDYDGTGVTRAGAGPADPAQQP